MPLYPYKCSAGHKFEARHKMDGSDAPTSCPEATGPQQAPHIDGGEAPDAVQCGAPITRQLAAPASHFPGADSWRR